MKKVIKYIVIILALVLLTGCGKNQGYSLIELTGPELLNALYNDNDIIYATINPNTEKGQAFIRDLKRVAKEHHTDIYYIDNTKLSFFNDEELYIISGIDTRKNYYYYSKDNNIAFEYESYKTLDSDLKGIKSKKITSLVSEEDKKKELELAKEDYNNGDIADSLNHLFNCWNLKEAKDFYNNSKYFKIIKEWDYRSVGKNEILVKKFALFNISNLLFVYEYNGSKAEYSEPKAKEYKDYKYKIKDDKIYISNGEDFVEKYKIISLTDDELILEDNKVQTVYSVDKKE